MNKAQVLYFNSSEKLFSIFSLYGVQANQDKISY